MVDSLSQSVPVLKALWRLAQRGAAPHIELIARESALTPECVRRHLRALDAAQLIDSGRRRLTLQGLALAVACSKARPVRRSSAVRGAVLPTVMLPVVTCRAPRPANVTGHGDARRM